MRYEINHFGCPHCGRLTSVPWNAAWCLHADNFSAHPPYSAETDWVRMVPVKSVVYGELPAEAKLWVVIEQQNSFSRPEGEVERPEDKWDTRLRSEPLEREAAYAEADRLTKAEKRPGWPSHGHSFNARPLDLAPVYLWEVHA